MRLQTTLLIAATLIGSWLGMQQVHELGHILAAWWWRIEIINVALHPLTISETQLSLTLRPLAVVWAGPICGCLLPLLILGGMRWLVPSAAFVVRFFAGFCLIANGCYLAFGSLTRAGDCAELLDHETPLSLLWLFGAITIPFGLFLWHGLGPDFGIGKNKKMVSTRVVIGTLCGTFLCVVIGLVVGR